MPFSAVEGVITPEEFETVLGVYLAVASMPWFTTAPDRREQFALVVLDSFRQGVTDRDDLLARCLSIAKQRFGNGGL